MHGCANEGEEPVRVQTTNAKSSSRPKLQDQGRETAATASIQDPINEPAKHPAEAAKFVTDMFDKVLKHNKTLAVRVPNLEKALGMFGPLLSGASLINSYRDTLKDIMERDAALQKALAQVDGSDPRFAGRQPDPQDVGCLVGQDAADAYVFFVNGSFSLGLGFDPGIQFSGKH